MPITKKEKDVIDTSAKIWGEFIALPELHKDHTNDFRFHIHALQNIILSRSAYRVLNNIEEIPERITDPKIILEF